jgi:DNA-binding response OmpR family regulator
VLWQAGASDYIAKPVDTHQLLKQQAAPRSYESR